MNKSAYPILVSLVALVLLSPTIGISNSVVESESELFLNTGLDLAIDDSDNIFVTGYTTGGLRGSNSGESDLILVKYNSDGQRQWTRQLGTSGQDEGKGITLDSSNNIYITGHTFGNTNGNPSSSGGLDGNSHSGSWDLFLVKYDSSGTKQWTKTMGTSATDQGRGVTVDSSNNIYVTGYSAGAFDGDFP